MNPSQMSNAPNGLSKLTFWSIEAEWFGREKLREGYQIGLGKGEDRLKSLIRAMKEAGNTLEFIYAETADKGKLPKLYKHYGIA